MGGYAEQLVYGLLLLLIFSVLANLHFINHRLQKKLVKKNDKNNYLVKSRNFSLINVKKHKQRAITSSVTTLAKES